MSGDVMGIVFVRTIMIYIFLMFALRIMGKRQLADLQPMELVVTLLISDLAVIAIEDNYRPFAYSVIPILLLISLELLVAHLSMKSVRLRSLFTGHPVYVIKNGVLQQNNMRRLRFTMEDLMEELRQRQISSLLQVQDAIMETNGKLSVFLKPQNKPVTAADLNLEPPPSALPVPIILDGKVLKENLPGTGLDMEWIAERLRERNIPGVKAAFFMTVDPYGGVFVLPKEGKP